VVVVFISYSVLSKQISQIHSNAAGIISSRALLFVCFFDHIFSEKVTIACQVLVTFYFVMHYWWRDFDRKFDVWNFLNCVIARAWTVWNVGFLLDMNYVTNCIDKWKPSVSFVVQQAHNV